MRRSRRQSFAPVPPHEMPPARTVIVPGRGEFFLRDSGETDPARPVVMLLHGWMVTADLNWHAAYDALVDAGYRVVAPDHRGHGRGLRAMAPFRLEDCAADAAAILRELGLAPAIVVGYSMGGVIAQVMARDHPDVMAGLVLSATCQHFQDPETRRTWKWMGVVGVALGVAPRQFYRAWFRSAKMRLTERTAWWLSELMRHEARDIAEAGRELGRFDSRPWLASVRADPVAMVLTGRDQMVSPAKQRELAQAAGAKVFEVAIDHLEVTDRAGVYNPALISAVAAVASPRGVPVA
ncbi:MAG: alpha/beta fold hydrolase [Solirubrobacteraceae bacterium]